MSLRTSLLRVLGFGVAGIVLLSATQLLLLSWETEPLISRTGVSDITTWIRRPPRIGAGILAGVGLAALAAYLLWTFFQSLRTRGGRVITTTGPEGWTKVDLSSLEDSIERDLRKVDQRNDVSVKIGRRGRIDVSITTPDPSSLGPTRELTDRLEELCEQRQLPCHSRRVTTTTPKRGSKGRVR